MKSQPERPTLTMPKKEPRWRFISEKLARAAFILLLCAFFQLQIFELNARIGKLCIKAGGTPDIRSGCNFTDTPQPVKARPTTPRRGN